MRLTHFDPDRCTPAVDQANFWPMGLAPDGEQTAYVITYLYVEAGDFYNVSVGAKAHLYNVVQWKQSGCI